MGLWMEWFLQVSWCCLESELPHKYLFNNHSSRWNVKLQFLPLHCLLLSSTFCLGYFYTTFTNVTRDFFCIILSFFAFFILRNVIMQFWAVLPGFTKKISNLVWKNKLKINDPVCKSKPKISDPGFGGWGLHRAPTCVSSINRCTEQQLNSFSHASHSLRLQLKQS